MPKGSAVISEDLAPLPESLILKGERGKAILIVADRRYRRPPAPRPKRETLALSTVLNSFCVKPSGADELFGLLSEVDGAIAVSKMVKSDVENYVNCPVKVVYPYADVERYAKVKADLKSKRAAFLGAHTFHKGVDLLLEAFKIVKLKEGSSELFVLSEGPLRSWVLSQKVEGVHAPGYVSKPEEFFAKASIYVHPARYEPFGISVVEAMCAGLIPIVTHSVGAKELVEELSSRLVVEPSREEIAERIVEVLSMPLDEKLRLSSKAKALASEFSKERSVESFVKAFNELTA